jgi:class 3 adenylate cyclase
MAETVSAQHLVEELNECFIAFDRIIDEYGLEKIKTIGDSYMCACGIPSAVEDHALRTVRAAIAITKYTQDHNEKRKERGLVPWELRIGIHSGPVIAGVVGRRKFAYDIWGSSVNIASRLEANGQEGKVNISEVTYQLIKDKFQCSYRGKIKAKNIGDVDMYFVEKELVTDGQLQSVPS